MIYTGIGSRQTPQDILDTMYEGAIQLADLGFTLRSGGANGADSAFEAGCTDGAGKMEIYLPWRLFNNNKSPLYTPSREAFHLAQSYHPNWSACSHGARALHARNCHQILGLDLQTPSDLVICWTQGGTGRGGTGQALRIAEAYEIPIFDLGSSDGLDRLNQFMTTIGDHHES